MPRRFIPTAMLAAASTFAASGPAVAALMPLDALAFAGSTRTTFGGIAEGTEVNGLSVDNLTFTYAGGNGAVVISSIGFTALFPSSNVSDPVLNAPLPMPAALTVEFDRPVSAFGFGFAFSAFTSDATALRITAFEGSDQLGTVTFGSAPDPLLVGGFAGVADDATAFDRVVINLTQEASEAFALDNFRTIPAAVPEPTTLSLLGLAALAALLRRHST